MENTTAHEHDEARPRRTESARQKHVEKTEGGKTSHLVDEHQPRCSETTMIVELPTENVDGSAVVVIQVYNLVAEINARIL